MDLNNDVGSTWRLEADDKPQPGICIRRKAKMLARTYWNRWRQGFPDTLVTIKGLMTRRCYKQSQKKMLNMLRITQVPWVPCSKLSPAT